MKPVLRRLLLLLPLVLLFLAAGSYLLLDVWLESSGGREVLGKALAARIGMPVELDEEFNIMLFPSVGVSGEGFRVGGDLKAGPFLTGREYEMSVALGPLMDRRVVVETVRLEGATVYPERFEREQRSPEEQTGGEFTIPEIRQIIFEDLSIVFPEREIPVRKIAFTGFAPGRETPFSIESDWLGLIEGGVTLDPVAGKTELGFTWSGHELGSAEVEVNLDLAAYVGSVDAMLIPAARDERLRLSSGFTYRPEGLYLNGLILNAASQKLAGSGCILRGPPLSVNLDLQTGFLDFESLEQLVPGGGGAGAGTLPDLRLRLRARELRARGATAHEAELRIGALPDCGESGMPVGTKAIQ